jgi:hypothetical protein
MGVAYLLPELASLPAAKPQAMAGPAGFGHSTIDELLPGGGLALGAVTELRANGAASGATTLALRACRVAQSRQREQRCVFIDPRGTLFAPAVARLGVDLERLIVVRPSWSELESVAALIADARAASLLVLDLQGAPTPAARAANPAAPAARPANDAGLLARLSLAVEGSTTSVLLLTRSGRLDEPLAPGVGARLVSTRVSEQALQLVVQGRPLRRGPTRVVPWSQIAELDDVQVPGVADGA